MGGRLGLESMAALPCNGWQAWPGISVRFGVEYACEQEQEFAPHTLLTANNLIVG